MLSATRPVSQGLSVLLVFAAVLVTTPERAAGQCWEWQEHASFDPHYMARLVCDQARPAVVALTPYLSGANQNVGVYQLSGQNNWSVVSTGLSPPGPRYQFASCYHGARQKVMLFGGHIGPAGTGTPMNDLWEWDGPTWSQVSHGGAWPQASWVAHMVYDPDRARIILLYYHSGGVWRTREWTGTAWEQGPDLGPVGGGPAHVEFCFDTNRNVGFVYTKDTTVSDVSQVWEYTPGPTAAQGSWALIPIVGLPLVHREGATLVWDPHRKHIIRQGGRQAGTTAYDVSTYYWEAGATRWSEPIAATQYGFEGAGGCFDTDADRVVVYGGVHSGVPLHEIRNLYGAAPGISVHPSASAVWCAGTSHVLAITAVGTMASNMQWFKDGNGLAGATSTILVVNSATPQHAGVYECRVWNSCGEVWSRPCTVGVASGPVTLQQPFFYYANVCPGGTMGFVQPLPAPGTLATLVLQKKFGEFWETVPVPYVPGEQAFIVANPQNADTGWYRLAAINGCVPVVSDQVHVQVGVTFDEQPQSLSLAPCQFAEFWVDAAGVGTLAYQWHKDGQPITDGGHISGAMTDTLTIAGARYDDEGSYHCVVTDTCETRETSAATLTLPTPGWVLRSPGAGAPYRLKHESDMAYDPIRGVCVLYGGYGAGGFLLDDTWEWDGIEWAQKFPPTNPGKRSGQELVFDPLRGAILLFGGAGNVLPNSEVWSYDGANWTLVTTSPGGPPVNEASHGDVAFDAARGKLVLVCEGQPSYPMPKNVTWEFDSAAATWQQVSAGVGPSHSYSPIAFNPEIERTIGQSYAQTLAPHLAATWLSFGTGWFGLASEDTPARYWPVMAYDATRKRTTIYGCCRNLGPGIYTTDTHAYLGEPWSQILPDFHTTQGNAVVPLGMAFDTKRRAMVMVGGSYDDYWAGVPLQTWEYRYLDKVVIDRQPEDQALTVGQNAAFTVHAAGVGTLSHEWRKGNTPLANGPTPFGSVISGATDKTLTITGVTAADAGSYTCVVSNACGALTTNPAMLGSVCYPDCNTSGTLTVADFGCFQGKYVLGDLYADCNASGNLTVADFGCFQGKYVLGCE